MTDPVTYLVKGYYAPGDGGGGVYNWSASDAQQVNLGSVVAKYDTNQYPTSGRWLLDHKGVVTVRQFGAIGDDDPVTRLKGQVGSRFDSDEHVTDTYLSVPGSPFSGLKLTNDDNGDTVDWAAFQAAIAWCGENGVRLEVPNGIYMVRRPVWVGDDATQVVSNDEEKTLKDVRATGLTMHGQIGLSRNQADNEAASVRLLIDCRFRYCLSRPISSGGDFKLRLRFRTGTVTTALLNASKTAAEIRQAIDDALNTTPGTFTVTLDVPDPSKTVSEQNVYFVTTPNAGSTDFLGEIDVIDNSTVNLVYQYRCYPDSAVMSFRRSAGVRYSVANLVLKGSPTTSNPPENTPRYASFGLAHVTTQFTEFEIDRIFVANSGTAYGILKGTGVNGEETMFRHLTTYGVYRGFLCTAPQAYLLTFYGWVVNPDNDGVYIELADAQEPGYGVSLLDCHGTFGGGSNADAKGTLVKVRRGTGIVRWDGGRIEHAATLFDYDAVDGQALNCNLDVILKNLELPGMKGGSTRNLVNGVTTGSGAPTQYSLQVEGCKLRMSTIIATGDADYVMKSQPGDSLRAVFTQCRFEGCRSVKTENVNPEFVRCWRSDYSTPGATNTALRLFNEASGLPVNRTQSVRTVVQDTPWIQTGPRVNLLRYSDFQGQAASSGPATPVAFNTGGAWTLVGDTQLAGFGKWGKFAEANISPSPEAFYIALKPATKVQNEVTAIDLNLPKGLISTPASKVVTYQCLCRVRGKMKFQMFSSISPNPVFDEVVVESPKDSTGAYVFSDTTLVSLRAQVLLAGPAVVNYAVVQLENLRTGTGEDSSLQVFWQQAWGGSEASTTFPLAGGLANAGQARTPDSTIQQNTYNWAVNALGVKAASRFQLPLLATGAGGDAEGMGWRSLVAADDYDLRDGEFYMDQSQVSVLGRADSKWYQFVQPERVASRDSSFTWEGQNERNIIFEGDFDTSTVTLSTDTTKVPRGSVVRVFVFNDDSVVTVKVGSNTLSTVNDDRMSEFLFYVDGSTGKWLVLADNVVTKRL